MSNYIDKIKKDGVIYNIRSIGAYLVEQEPVAAPSGISGNLNYEPDEEKGYQVLDTIYSAGQINTITYGKVVCHLLTLDTTYNTAYYISAFEPTTVIVPEESGGEEVGGGEVESGGGLKKAALKSSGTLNPGDEVDGAEAILIALIGGKFITHQIITAASVPNDIFVDTSNEWKPDELLLEDKYYNYQDWFSANMGAYLERKQTAWEEENGISGGEQEESGGKRRPDRLPEIDENFEPTIKDLIWARTLSSNDENGGNEFMIKTADILLNSFVHNTQARIFLTGLMPMYTGEELDPIKPNPGEMLEE